MWARRERAGVVLDAVLAVAFLLVAAFVLDKAGVTFGDLWTGALRFFGR